MVPRLCLSALLVCLGLLSLPAPAQTKVIRDVEYARVGETALKLDLYRPEKGQKSLLLVQVHGGAWRAGSKDDMPLGKLVALGYPVASVDYRLSGTAPFPAQIHDLKAAIRFLRAEGKSLGVESRQIAVIGESAGGHLAALVGVTNGVKELEGPVGTHPAESSSVQAAISLFGASNLETILVQSTPQGLKMRVPALQLLLGGQPSEKPELARLASPVAHVTADDPPLLLIHGEDDPQMPPEQARELHRAYGALGLRSQLEIIPGARHGGGEFFDERRIALMNTFLTHVEKQRWPAAGDVSFGPSPHQLLDVYLPPASAAPAPVVLWFGGLWEPAKGVPDLSRFLPRNVAVIGVESRTLKDGVAEQAQPPISYPLRDAIRAVQYVRHHAADWHLDPARIAVGGSSQGALPALYVGSAADGARPDSADPVERESSRVVCVAAHRSQPSIDPRRMQEWVPGVKWGAPAFGGSFEDSLARYEEIQPLIRAWSPEALLHPGAAPVYFENNWGLTQPEGVSEADYQVHSPAWGLGFQKLAEQAGVKCLIKYPGHPTEGYEDIMDFVVKSLQAPLP